MSTLTAVALVVVAASGVGVLALGLLTLYQCWQIWRERDHPHGFYRTRRPDWSAAPPPYPPRGTDTDRSSDA